MKVNPVHSKVVNQLLDLCYSSTRNAMRRRVHDLGLRALREAEEHGFTGWEFSGVEIYGWYGTMRVILGTTNVAGNEFALQSEDRTRVIKLFRFGSQKGVRYQTWDIARLITG